MYKHVYIIINIGLTIYCICMQVIVGRLCTQCTSRQFYGELKQYSVSKHHWKKKQRILLICLILARCSLAYIPHRQNLKSIERKGYRSNGVGWNVCLFVKNYGIDENMAFTSNFTAICRPFHVAKDKVSNLKIFQADIVLKSWHYPQKVVKGTGEEYRIREDSEEVESEEAAA